MIAIAGGFPQPEQPYLGILSPVQVHLILHLLEDRQAAMDKAMAQKATASDDLPRAKEKLATASPYGTTAHRATNGAPYRSTKRPTTFTYSDETVRHKDHKPDTTLRDRARSTMNDSMYTPTINEWPALAERTPKAQHHRISQPRNIPRVAQL